MTMQLRLALNKLNGWQRIWVLLSVIWLLIVGYWAIEDWPGTGNCYYRIGSATCISSHHCSGMDMEKSINESLPELASSSVGSATCHDLHESIAQSGRRTEVINLYQKHLAERRAKFFAQMFAYWLIPSAFTYLAGLGFGWVILGFRRNDV